MFIDEARGSEGAFFACSTKALCSDRQLKVVVEAAKQQQQVNSLPSTTAVDSMLLVSAGGDGLASSNCSTLASVYESLYSTIWRQYQDPLSRLRLNFGSKSTGRKRSLNFVTRGFLFSAQRVCYYKDRFFCSRFQTVVFYDEL